MEAVEREGRRFECPCCGAISVHQCNPGARIDVWCQRCKETTSYIVRADGRAEVREEE
jgi:hypothetical protein